jgi:subtilisin family serine protease
VPQALTVGATEPQSPGYPERIADFSNFGTCVDLWAPGTMIKAASCDSDSAWAWMHGTSVAAPHVAGAVAALRQLRPELTPPMLSTAMLCMASEGVLPQDSLRGAPNLFLFAGKAYEEKSLTSCGLVAPSPPKPPPAPLPPAPPTPPLAPPLSPGDQSVTIHISVLTDRWPTELKFELLRLPDDGDSDSAHGEATLTVRAPSIADYQ